MPDSHAAGTQLERVPGEAAGEMAWLRDKCLRLEAQVMLLLQREQARQEMAAIMGGAVPYCAGRPHLQVIVGGAG